MQLSYDDRATGGATVENPTWDAIEAAIRRLDDSDHTEVTLGEADDLDDFIGIGGGDGDYSLFIWQKRNLIPYDASKPDEDIIITTGRQSVWANRRELLGLEDALVAAKHYFETGKASPAIHWKED